METAANSIQNLGAKELAEGNDKSRNPKIKTSKLDSSCYLSLLRFCEILKEPGTTLGHAFSVVVFLSGSVSK